MAHSKTQTPINGLVEPSHGPRILDIGCGTNKVPGAIGMDVNPRTAADVIHDLDVLPYPFADDEFDHVEAAHCLEHLE